MILSVVIPFYNEAKQIPVTLTAVRATLATLTADGTIDDHEIVAIDDGSRDDSRLVLRREHGRDARLRVLAFSRNFGKEAALCAGLDVARGDAVIVMDGDLQHPPEKFSEMLALWREGAKVVEGVKTTRGRESMLNRINSNLFYRLFRRVSGLNLKNASDFKLLDRQVVDAWKRLGERNTFFRALSAWLGYSRATFTFDVAPRQEGRSKWSRFGLIRLSMNAITGFSATPLYLVAFVGIVLLIACAALTVQTLVRYLLGTAVAGFTTVIVLELLIGGAALVGIGLIGVYIGRIFDEVKARPRYLVEYDSDVDDRC